jgi:hypothetical protein
MSEGVLHLPHTPPDNRRSVELARTYPTSGAEIRRRKLAGSVGRLMTRPSVPEIMRNAWLQIAKVAKEPTCPMCQGDKWKPLGHFAGLVVLTAEGEPAVADYLITGAPIGTQGATFGAVAYTCNRCQFVRFHHYSDSLDD